MNLQLVPEYRASARAALPAALLLGFAAERLLINGPLGPGFPIWIAMFGATSVLMTRQAQLNWQRETIVGAALAFGAAVVFATRASEALHLLAFLALITAASLPALRARSFQFGKITLAAHAFGFFLVGAHAAGGALLLPRDVGATRLPAGRMRGVTVATRGVLLAVPPLVVFGALFASADPLFERYLNVITQFVAEDLVAHVMLALFFAWVTAGLLRALLPNRSPEIVLPQLPRIPATEIAIALGAVATLFLAFVAVQARWLFNGAEALAAITGLTAADYARRGFFELVAASALTLPLLLTADAVTRDAPTRPRRTIRLLSGSIVLLVLVIMGSALERMALYTARFGLTEQRVYATALMAWLGVVFAWYVITTLRGRRHRFAAGPVVAGIVAAFTLAVVNPDALIARVNLDRAHQGAEVDATYLAALSADAAPVLLRRLNEVPASARCDIARKLLKHGKNETVLDWRSANYSMVRAHNLAHRNAPILKRIETQECTQQS